MGLSLFKRRWDLKAIESIERDQDRKRTTGKVLKRNVFELKENV